MAKAESRRGGEWSERDYGGSEGGFGYPAKVNGLKGAGAAERHWRIRRLPRRGPGPATVMVRSDTASVTATKRRGHSDYHHWRGQQIKKFDQDYDEWRNERRKKFSEDFDKWRSNRSSMQSQDDKTNKKSQFCIAMAHQSGGSSFSSGLAAQVLY